MLFFVQYYVLQACFFLHCIIIVTFSTAKYYSQKLDNFVHRRFAKIIANKVMYFWIGIYYLDDDYSYSFI